MYSVLYFFYLKNVQSLFINIIKKKRVTTNTKLQMKHKIRKVI